jgi:hypothetical protein
MSIHELRDLMILIVVAAVPAAGLSFLTAKYRTDWSRRRALLAAALPVPGAVWALCLGIFVSSANASDEQCGVDACGMAMIASLAVGVYAAIAFGLCLAVAWLTYRAAHR